MTESWQWSCPANGDGSQSVHRPSASDASSGTEQQFASYQQAERTSYEDGGGGPVGATIISTPNMSPSSSHAKFAHHHHENFVESGRGKSTLCSVDGSNYYIGSADSGADATEVGIQSQPSIDAEAMLANFSPNSTLPSLGGAEGDNTHIPTLSDFSTKTPQPAFNETTPLMPDANRTNMGDADLGDISSKEEAMPWGLDKFREGNGVIGQILHKISPRDSGSAQGGGIRGEKAENFTSSVTMALSGLNTTKILHIIIACTLLVIAILTVKVAKIQGMNNQLQSEVDNILELLHQKESEIDSLDSKLSDVTMEESDLAEKATRSKELDNVLKSDVHELIQRIDETDTEMAKVMAEKDALVERLIRLEEETGHLEERVDAVEADNVSLKAVLQTTPVPTDAPTKRPVHWKWKLN